MNKISYSQFSKWANCPLDWKLKYVDGHRVDDTSIHTIFGTAMHEVIQEWLDTLYNKSETVAKSVYLDDTLKEKLLTLFKENIIGEGDSKVFLCDKQTLMEFYQQGCQILSYIQKNSSNIFPTKKVKLHSIEFPLEIEVKPNVVYIGFIDIVTYDEEEDLYTLYDLKTSKSGWSEYQKKDLVKTSQLLLYKRFFAQQLNIPEKNITVKFVILKRIIYENSNYIIPRASNFVPSNGKPSVDRAWGLFNKFIDECFDSVGEYNPNQVATPSKDACRFCKFKDNKDLCSVAVDTDK